MKIELKTLPEKLQPLFQFVKKYVVFMFFVGMLVIFAFLVYRINQYSSKAPTEDDVQGKLQTVQRPKIDPAVVEKIEQLQSQNIQVQSLFDHARDNPFNE